MVLKTPKIRYADGGFIRQARNYINIELFNASIPILDLTISKDICINKICYKKTRFNQEFFKYKYYDDFLSDIVLFKPIFNKKNLQKTKDGFKQSIQNQKINIFYEVSKEMVIFRDKKQRVYIKIKKIKQ